MKITVVIPSYNAEKYLSRCISSLESQTRKDFDIIFVDDCSQDGTFEMLRKYQTESVLNIRIIHNKDNRGPAYSRNQGILNAESEFITFCDIDDWYEPDFLEEMILLLENTSSDLVLCGYNVVNPDGYKEKRPLIEKSCKVDESTLFGLDADSLCMLMVKTSLMKETLLPDLRNGEDVATVSLLMAKANGVAVSNKCLYNYFRRPGSASESPSMRVVDSLISSFKYTKENFPAKKECELEYLGIKNLLYAAIIILFTFSFNTKKARSIISDFENDFPKWINNKYLTNLNFSKSLVICLVKYRMFIPLKALALLRKYLLK